MISRPTMDGEAWEPEACATQEKIRLRSACARGSMASLLRQIWLDQLCKGCEPFSRAGLRCKFFNYKLSTGMFLRPRLEHFDGLAQDAG
jgi:hypothetical protein